MHDIVELSQETSIWQQLNLLQIASEPDGREICVLHTAERFIFLAFQHFVFCSVLSCCGFFFCSVFFMFSCTFALLQGLEKVLSRCLCLMLWFCVLVKPDCAPSKADILV